MSFIEEHKVAIDQLNEDIVDFIISLNIDFSDEITLSQILKINGQINKLIFESKELVAALNAMLENEKISTVALIMGNALNTPEITKLLPKKVKKQLLDFCEQTNNLVELLDLVRWVSKNQLDTNKDGVVSDEEIQANAESTCGCFGAKCVGCYSDMLKYVYQPKN